MYQEIVLRLWEAWPSFDGRAQRSTWLYRVALNVAISARRQQSRRPAPARLNAAALEIAAPPDPGPDSDDHIRGRLVMGPPLNHELLAKYSLEGFAQFIGVAQLIIGLLLLTGMWASWMDQLQGSIATFQPVV